MFTHWAAYVAAAILLAFITLVAMTNPDDRKHKQGRN